MITPATILRDTSLAGLMLTVCGYGVDRAFAGSVAAGALGALLNLWFLTRVVQAAANGAGALFGGRLVLKQFLGLAILGGLAARLPVLPILVGFCSVLVALSARAVLGLLSAPLSGPPVEALPLEQG